MQVENAVYPTPERLEALRTELTDPATEPVMMLNLLKFRDQASYPDGRSTSLTGQEAYLLYAAGMRQLIEQHGGRILFTNDIASVVIGQVENTWDLCAVVEYPSITAFAKIMNLAASEEISLHRDAGLAGQLLLRLGQPA
ncbi:MAG: DUF1330 domain-containing protein [Mycobacteriaceae bacterium]|nr:DUF1330 domain-containing protein [Mycobacteriaceae bacterium]